MLTKVSVEKALNADLNEHLGYQKHQSRTSSNSRNGCSGKSIVSDDVEVDIDFPLDREDSFKPPPISKLVRIHQTRFRSFWIAYWYNLNVLFHPLGYSPI
ncbi:transposase [Vibrio sp. A1-b2]|nr:transposase [Vibrio sp. A1-b2]MCF7364547.1 transposase [Vibrio sp. A1-b2]